MIGMYERDKESNLKEDDNLSEKFQPLRLLWDFALGNNSPLAEEQGKTRPKMGNNSMRPPFESLYTLLAWITRHLMPP